MKDYRDNARIIAKIIRENNTMTLSTKNKNGQIWATKVFYGESGSDIYVILEKNGHAYNNILENNEVFFVIDKNDPSSFIQGVAEAKIVGDTSNTPERSIVTRKNYAIVPFLRSNNDTVVVKLEIKKLYVSYFVEGWKPRFEVEVDDYMRELIKKEINKVPKIKYYIQSTRPWSLVATFGAVLIGTLVSPVIDIFKFILVLVGAFSVHLGVNAIS
ncbi:MAG: pyridoxamine 5'-phosphate oxidase family protein, partial [Brevinematia bacterium]